MRRGDVVGVALPGDTGKPRPALIVQSDQLDSSTTILVVPFTSELVDTPITRLTIAATTGNGLHHTSQLMFERITHAQRKRCHGPYGRLTAEDMLAADGRIAAMLGLANDLSGR